MANDKKLQPGNGHLTEITNKQNRNTREGSQEKREVAGTPSFTCPSCGLEMKKIPPGLHCPRCNQNLLSALQCDGNCGQCQQQNPYCG